jgi:uncharacterized Zn-finger protein
VIIKNNYKTNRNSHLNRHINSVHKNIRNYLCDRPNCGQSFTQNSSLKRHEKIRLKLKSFKCDYNE